MAKNNTNDSQSQQQAKKQNHNLKNKAISDDKHLNGPNHPST